MAESPQWHWKQLFMYHRQPTETDEFPLGEVISTAREVIRSESTYNTIITANMDRHLPYPKASHDFLARQ